MSTRFLLCELIFIIRLCSTDWRGLFNSIQFNSIQFVDDAFEPPSGKKGDSESEDWSDLDLDEVDMEVLEAKKATTPTTDTTPKKKKKKKAAKKQRTTNYSTPTGSKSVALKSMNGKNSAIKEKKVRCVCGVATT